ncbi:MAG: deoxyribonuclease IV [Deltaproteobacteria bacterium]|nr:deoxyribonuclease IV [Deltaproteobacteria bacterium]
MGRHRTGDQRNSCLLGAHFSIAKGLHQALFTAEDYGCTAVQIFTKNASTWKEKTLSSEDIRVFDEARKKTRIRHIASHTSYLINLASPEKKKYAMSCEALKQELIRCSALKIPLVVLHPGSHMDSGEGTGIERIASAINRVFDKLPENPTRLLLETTAGQGSGLGHTFEQIAAMMGKVEDMNRLGVCLDTCHIFAAGYDLRTKAAYQKTFTTFDAVIGLEHLYWIHLNDSKREMGTRIDRHENIGKGFIGETAFKLLINDSRMQHIPKVLETPKGKGEKDWDQINLAKLRGFLR